MKWLKNIKHHFSYYPETRVLDKTDLAFGNVARVAIEVQLIEYDGEKAIAFVFIAPEIGGRHELSKHSIDKLIYFLSKYREKVS
jgi:hypothetical protein